MMNTIKVNGENASMTWNGTYSGAGDTIYVDYYDQKQAWLLDILHKLGLCPAQPIFTIQAEAYVRNPSVNTLFTNIEGEDE